MLLVVGAHSDQNVSAIYSCAEKKGIPVTPLILRTEGDGQTVSWDVYENTLKVNDHELSEVSSCFIRQPLSLDDDTDSINASNWFFALYGWLQSNPHIKILNREAGLNYLNKPYILHLAKQVGLHIPFTLVSNDLVRVNDISKNTELIAKPVNGAGYCVDFESALKQFDSTQNKSASPAIIQNKMVYPEYRVFKIGEKFHCYRLMSEDTDYRLHQNVDIEYISNNILHDEINGLNKMAEYLKLDFLAADFKTCPQSGQPAFLEINNAPMFSAFDQKSNQKLVNDVLMALVP